MEEANVRNRNRIGEDEMGEVRHKALGELLPEQGINDLITLVKAHPNPTIDQLKGVTRKYKDELLTKGVDADYLAYALQLYVVRGTL
jgi:hypothetical protein